MRAGRLLPRVGLALLGLGILAGFGLALIVRFFPERVARATVDSWRRAARLVPRDVTLPDGTRYAYLEGGSGEALMLLHGFGGDKDNFVPVATFLTGHYRVIIPDHVGFGDSDKPMDADYRPAAQADRLHGLAERLGLERVHLGGNSMGGQIAMAYAARHSNAVASLWLLAPAGLWSATKSPVVQDIADGKPNPMLVRNEEDFAKLFRLVVENPPPVPDSVLRFMAQARIRNLPLEERIFAQIRGDSLEPSLRGLSTPALIVWGQKDRVLHPDGATLLRTLLAHSEVILMPEVGHVPMVEAPKRTAEDYLRFRQHLASAVR